MNRMVGFAAAVLAVALALAGCSRGPARRSLEWTVMGTVARVQVRAADAASADSACTAASAVVRDVFFRIEKLLNAHVGDSELSRLAGFPDAEVLAKCDPLVAPCYAAAFRLAEESGGAFSPRWKGPGTLDLGAIAKGFAVDCAADAVASIALVADSSGRVPDVLIDLGGNLKAARGAWRVGARDPYAPGGVGDVFELAEGAACATSGEYERGRHIYDARTGRQVEATVTGVTVVHPASAMLADGLSTTMFIFGRARGEAFIAAHYPAARVLWFGAEERK